MKIESKYDLNEQVYSYLDLEDYLMGAGIYEEDTNYKPEILTIINISVYDFRGKPRIKYECDNAQKYDEDELISVKEISTEKFKTRFLDKLSLALSNKILNI